MLFGGWSTALRSPSPDFSPDADGFEADEINHLQEINNTEYGDDGQYRPNPFALAKRRAQARAALGVTESQGEAGGKKPKRGNVLPAAEPEDLAVAKRSNDGDWQGTGGKRKAETASAWQDEPHKKKKGWQKPTGWTNSKGEPLKPHVINDNAKAGSSTKTQQKSLIEALDTDIPVRPNSPSKGKKKQGVKGKKAETKAKSKKKQEVKKDEDINFATGAGPGSSFPIVQGLEKQKSLPVKSKRTMGKAAADPIEIDSSQESLDLIKILSKFDHQVKHPAHAQQAATQISKLESTGGRGKAGTNSMANLLPSKASMISNPRAPARARDDSQAPSLQRSGLTAESDSLQTPSIPSTQGFKEQDQPSTMTHLSVDPFAGPDTTVHAESDDPPSSACPPYSSPLQDKSTDGRLIKHADGIARPVPRKYDCIHPDHVNRLEDSVKRYRKDGVRRPNGLGPIAGSRQSQSHADPDPAPDLPGSSFALPSGVWSTFTGPNAPAHKPTSSRPSWRNSHLSLKSAPARRGLPRLLAPLQIFKPETMIPPAVPNEVPFWLQDQDERPGEEKLGGAAEEPRMVTGRGYNVTLWQPTPKGKLGERESAPRHLLPDGRSRDGRIGDWYATSRPATWTSEIEAPKTHSHKGGTHLPIFRGDGDRGEPVRESAFGEQDDWMAEFRKPEATGFVRAGTSALDENEDEDEDSAINRFKWKKPAGFGLAR